MIITAEIEKLGKVTAERIGFHYGVKDEDGKGNLLTVEDFPLANEIRVPFVEPLSKKSKIIKGKEAK